MQGPEPARTAEEEAKTDLFELWLTQAMVLCAPLAEERLALREIDLALTGSDDPELRLYDLEIERLRHSRNELAGGPLERARDVELRETIRRITRAHTGKKDDDGAKQLVLTRALKAGAEALKRKSAPETVVCVARGLFAKEYPQHPMKKASAEEWLAASKEENIGRGPPTREERAAGPRPPKGTRFVALARSLKLMPPDPDSARRRERKRKR